jgi:hypothetical protein
MVGGIDHSIAKGTEICCRSSYRCWTGGAGLGLRYPHRSSINSSEAEVVTFVCWKVPTRSVGGLGP